MHSTETSIGLVSSMDGVVTEPIETEQEETGKDGELDIDIEIGGLDNHKEVDLPFLTHERTEERTPPASPKSASRNTPKSTAPSWTGFLRYKSKALDLKLPASGFHINGPLVEEHMPLILTVGHRMPLEQLLAYLPKIDFSATRNRTCIYFEAEEGEKANYQALFQTFRSADRAAVVSIDKSSVIGVNASFFKELYVFPLAASDPVPSFINDQDYDRDLEDMLIGVFLTDKEKELVNTFTVPTDSSTLYEDEDMKDDEAADAQHLLRNLQSEMLGPVPPHPSQQQQGPPGFAAAPDIFSTLNALAQSKTFSDLTRGPGEDLRGPPPMGGYGPVPPHPMGGYGGPPPPHPMGGYGGPPPHHMGSPPRGNPNYGHHQGSPNHGGHHNPNMGGQNYGGPPGNARHLPVPPRGGGGGPRTRGGSMGGQNYGGPPNSSPGGRRGGHFPRQNY